MSQPASPGGRTAFLAPVVMLIAAAVGCAMLANGLRASFGLFLAPMTAAHGWTGSGFAFAIALQILLNGATQPLWGQVADRFGGRVVLSIGAVLYCIGIVGMALADGLPLFTFFAGVVLGIAVSAAGMPTISASLTRLLSPEMRGRAVGLGTAGTSAGQFLVVPLASFAISAWGWQGALYALAAAALLMIPLAIPLNDTPQPKAAGAAAEQTAGEALSGALRDPSFWFLFWGFFVCGLHVSFIGVHMPGFVHSCGLPAFVGAASISIIGLFNIGGSLVSGELSSKWRRRELLVAIYAGRGVLMALFMLAEKTTLNVMLFSGAMGLLWLSTVPPTVSLVARNYGTRWLATIFGIIYLGHQIGGFTGAWLGGIVFDRTGSYDLMWIIGILAAAFAALVHLPVRDGPPAARPATA